MASTFPVNKRADNRLSINDPNSEYSQYLTHQQPNTNPLQSLESMTSSSIQRAGRPRSQAAFSSHGPSSSESSQHSSQISSSSSSSTSSRSSTNESSPALVRYTLTDNPVRAQPPRQPAHRSKLSKQYSPSDSEDSDDEPLALQSSHQHTYMYGPAVELSSAAESLRAISRLDMDQTAERSLTPVQPQESVDTARVKTLSVKLTLAKRISRLFGGGSKNSKKSSHILTNEATASTSDVEGSPYQNKLPSIEIINDVLKQEFHPPNMSIHQQRSHPNPEYAYTSGGNGVQHTQHTRRTAIREASLNTIDVGNHRRYSASTGPSAPSTPTTPTSSHHPLQRQRSPSGTNLIGHSNRSSMSGVEDLDFDQLPYRPYGQDPRFTPSGSPVLPAAATSSHSRDNSNNTHSSSPRSTTPMDDHLRIRRSTVNDASSMLPSVSRTTPPRRSSTPLIVSETLVSRIDREKSTVCFQVPNARRDSYSRDANLDPALTSLVQQHRKDYQTNLRLGGAPHQSLPHVPTQTTPQPFVQPQLHSSPLLMESLLPNTRDREVRGPASRRDSNEPHASSMAGPHPTHPLGAPNPGTPGLLPTESHSRRLSSNQIQTAHNSYISEANGTYLSSHGNLLNAAANSSVKSQQQQQQQQQLFRQLQNYQQVQQPSPQLTPQGSQPGSQGRHRPTSRRHSGSSYFNISPQQKPYSVVQSTAHVSPFPSPVIGATGSTLGYTHELSVAMQHQQYQQQQVQLQIQQQQLHNLQQQQVQQQSPNCQVSPLALLQNQSAQQHQQQQQSQQQQIEQLQLIRMQQQQLLFQQQQQLQQQLEQARAAVTASTTTTTISPLTPDIATGSVASLQRQQQQHSMVNHGVPLHFALPAAPVLTTAMGLGVGMNMNPLSIMGMGMGPQPPTMIPQLVMTPPLTPQLVGYTTPMYSYQQIPTSAIPAQHVPVHVATGGASARSSAVVGY